MKKCFTLLFLLAAFFCSSSIFANTVYISGTVTNNGVPVANKAVRVWTDSLAAGTTCYQVHIKYTNAAGIYVDTLNCNTITSVKTSVEGCGGALVINTNAVNSNNSVTSNFALQCTTPPVGTCAANFTMSVTGNSVSFVNTSTSSSNSVASLWNFGNGFVSTIANPTTTYPVNGTYLVCLLITSSTGCTDSICKTVTITANTSCNAEFQAVRDSSNYKMYRFFAGVNTSAPNNDPVVERKWKFGNGDSLGGNVQNPVYTYANPGTYNVCLRVKTQSGCISESCKQISVTPPPFICGAVAAFTYIPVSSLVKFNSANSLPGLNDTIISRKWNFGDGSTPLTGNIVDPQYQYAQPGIYTVCLTIKTVKGCESNICLLVTATNVNSNCVPQFVYQRIAPKKIAFNSSMSWAPANDSIIERKWSFGDGSTQLGNVVSPVHEYLNFGVYTVCLRTKTALGCVNEVCKPVLLQDSIVPPPPGVNEPIKILSLYPNPVHNQMTTVVWSAPNNVAAELAIYDVYGNKKWSMTKNLLQGNNITIVPTAFLQAGPYIFRVTTSHGIKSRNFYKL